MPWIALNATNPPAPNGAQNVHFRADQSHLGTQADPQPVSAYLAPFTGDAGTGGASGIVPAPAAGDAAAGKVLKADGTWYVPPGMANPMTTQGDLIVGGASGTPTRLAAGTAGQVLTSNGPGVAPSYQMPASDGGGGGWTPTPPVAASFTTVRNALATAPTIADNALGVGIEMTFQRSNASGSWPQAYFLQAAPSAPFRAEALISESLQSSNNWFMMGLSVSTDNAADVGKHLTVCTQMSGSQTFPYSKINTSLTAQEVNFATVNPPSLLLTQQSTFWMAIEWDGTNINAYASFDGYAWWKAASEPGTFFTGTPNLVGFGWEATASDNGIQYVWCPHFRLTTNLSDPFGLNR